VPIDLACFINSACRHETRAGLLFRWLRNEGEAIPLERRITLLREISAATDSRDRAIRALALNAPESGPVDSSGQPMTAQQAVLAKLRELPPEILAEYRKQFPTPKRPDPPELVALQKQERQNEIERQWMADWTADTRGGLAADAESDGTQSGALVGSVVRDGLDDEPGPGAVNGADETGDDP